MILGNNLSFSTMRAMESKGEVVIDIEYDYDTSYTTKVHYS